jgi:hypothetical protein
MVKVAVGPEAVVQQDCGVFAEQSHSSRALTESCAALWVLANVVSRTLIQDSGRVSVPGPCHAVVKLYICVHKPVC